MDVDGGGGAAADPPAPAADAFSLDLRKHERVLREVFISVSPE